jgi:hypothetical protein
MKLKKGRKVKIGVLRHHPRECVNGKWEPSWHEWVDSFETGMLHGWFTESNEDGSTVVGLVELEDGHFDTFAAARLKVDKEVEGV